MLGSRTIARGRDARTVHSTRLVISLAKTRNLTTILP
jgi:hypothetical protein